MQITLNRHILHCVNLIVIMCPRACVQKRVSYGYEHAREYVYYVSTGKRWLEYYIFTEVSRNKKKPTVYIRNEKYSILFFKTKMVPPPTFPPVPSPSVAVLERWAHHYTHTFDARTRAFYSAAHKRF